MRLFLKSGILSALTLLSVSSSQADSMTGKLGMNSSGSMRSDHPSLAIDFMPAWIRRCHWRKF